MLYSILYLWGYGLPEVLLSPALVRVTLGLPSVAVFWKSLFGAVTKAVSAWAVGVASLECRVCTCGPSARASLALVRWDE